MMLFIWHWELACSHLLVPMCGSATSCEAVMSEAFTALLVALALAAYLVHALLKPEKY